MLTKWKVFNFKSIREETELPLGPLTIFAGANSSGKSTMIQSMLLIAQTLSHKVGSRSVVLNGALTSLGQFDDLRSSGSASNQISIKCTCKPLAHQDAPARQRSALSRALYGYRPDQLQEISCEISFDADPSSPQRDIYQIQPRLFATQLSCTARDEDNLDAKAEILIRHSDKMLSGVAWASDASEIDDQIRAGLSYAVDLDENSLSEVREDVRSANPVGCILHHFLPERIVYEIDPLQEEANAITSVLQEDGRRTLGIRRGAGKETVLSKEVIAVLRDVLKGTIDFDEVFKAQDPRNFLIGIDAEAMTLQSWYERIRSVPRDKRVKVQQVLRETENLFDRIHTALKSASDAPEAHTLIQARPPDQIAEASSYLDNFFSSSLKYLGPLRDEPKPLYPLAPAADPYDVGLRGEHTASILELHKNKKIKYIPSTSFKSPQVDRKMVTRTLEAAVVDWLQYLGVASSAKSLDKGKLGHELKVALANSESTYDLTHVGVGVSQVLPILVICLLADSDSTLVFEQPELHLHPKVQTLLGDFFLSMALCNKQCIVETHSEYFIDRLRFRIASADKELNSLTKIYFVEKSSETSSFREVVINEYGAISDWPEGFFDQSQKQAEEILRAAAAKRKASRGNGDA